MCSKWMMIKCDKEYWDSNDFKTEGKSEKICEEYDLTTYEACADGCCWYYTTSSV